MQPNQRPHLIWDLPLRLWHWALVICLLGSWITAEAGFDWTTTHFYFGYTALGLVLFRLAWGILGTTHSRYRNFLVSPRKVIDYLQGTKSWSRTAGHNPAGGWASLGIVLLIGTQAVCGLFISDDIFYAGPYNSVVSTSTADWLGAWHHRLFTLIQLVVAVHLVAVSWYTWGKKEYLIQAMWHGKKQLSDDNVAQAITQSKLFRALFAVIAAGLLVTALVCLAPVAEYDDYF